MNKLKFSARIFICVLMAAALFACGSKDDKKAEKTKIIKLSDNITLDFPESWEIESMSKNTQLKETTRQKSTEILGDSAPKEFDILLASKPDPNGPSSFMVMAFYGSVHAKTKQDVELASTSSEALKELNTTMQKALPDIARASSLSSPSLTPIKVVKVGSLKSIVFDVSGKTGAGQGMVLSFQQIPLPNLTIQFILAYPQNDAALKEKMEQIRNSAKITN